MQLTSFDLNWAQHEDVCGSKLLQFKVVKWAIITATPLVYYVQSKR